MSPMPNYSALVANKTGRLTQAQRVSLIPMILIGGIFFLIGGSFAGGIIYAFISGTFKGSVIAAIIFGGGISLVLLWIGYRVGGTRLIDMFTAQVRYIDGPGTKGSGIGPRSLSGSSGGVYYLYSVGEMQFQISRKIYQSLPASSKKIRAYYTPFSKTLVNIELLYS